MNLTLAPPSVVTAEKSAKSVCDARPAILPSWLRVSVADVLLALMVVGLAPRMRDSMLDDPGLGWHLRNVNAMLAEGKFLTHDSFSGPRLGEPWLANQWLGDAVLWCGWKWGGLEGIGAVTILVLALTFRYLFGALTRDGVAWPLAAVWTYLGLLGTSISWVARPNLFTILFVMVTAIELDRFHRGGSARRLALLVPLLGLWANVHGGFTAGLMMLAVAGAVEVSLAMLAGRPETRLAARARIAPLAAVGCGAFVATLVNPYGWRVYPWIFKLLGDPYFMGLHTEWQSPDFHAVGAFRVELLMLLMPLVLAATRRRPSATALALSLVWLHFALSGQRYVALWVVATVPMLARASAGIPWLRSLGSRLKLSPELRAMLTRRPGRATIWPAVVVALMLCWARGTTGYAAHDPTHIPAAALDHALAGHQAGQMFHDYNWGGYVTWHAWPRVRNWIDDRNEVQGREHIENYFAIVDGREAYRPLFEARDVRTVCVRPGVALDRSLASDPRWRESYRDAWAVVWVRVEAQ